MSKTDKSKNVNDLLKESKMSKTEFAKFFNIPLRTVDNWTTTSNNRRKCASYIVELMEYKLKNERKIK